MFNYRFDVILSHKKFTCIDFGRVYIPYIPTPRRYASGTDSAHAKCRFNVDGDDAISCCRRVGGKRLTWSRSIKRRIGTNETHADMMTQ